MQLHPSVRYAAAGLVVVWAVYLLRPCDGTRLDEHRALASVLRSSGTMLWPAALVSVVRPEHRACRALTLPLLWPLGLWVVDSALLHFAPPAKPDAPASVRLEPTSVTALSFGLSGLLGARSDSTYVHLFVTAIVLCMAAVLPTHSNLNPQSKAAIVFENVQRSLLVWCIGLLLAGVTLTRLCSTETTATTVTLPTTTARISPRGP